MKTKRQDGGSTAGALPGWTASFHDDGPAPVLDDSMLELYGHLYLGTTIDPTHPPKHIKPRFATSFLEFVRIAEMFRSSAVSDVG